MVFSSFQFLFVFLPLFLLLYAVTPTTRGRNYLVLAASLLFYIWGEKGYVALLLLSIVSTWAFGIGLDRTQGDRARKLVLAAGVIFNLAILIYCKYLVFLVGTFVSLASAMGYPPKFVAPASVHLPLGVSFFVFQAISYLADVYRRDVQCQRSLLIFGMYKSCFPQLIAGPIVRYAQIQSQVYDRPFTAGNYHTGMWRFMIGLSQKVLLANPCGSVADQVFNAAPGSFGPGVAWVGTIAYALQIYFDFCGYSNMAIGLGKVMGFNFPENFNRPYESVSMIDFWRRWHMSLSTWFRDYVYVPLGGNRVSAARTYVNLMIVFLLCGLWHGAAWTFVLWGGYHGLFLIVERTAAGKKILASTPSFVARTYVLIVVLFGWVLFRSNTLAQASSVASTMLGFPMGTATSEQFKGVPLTLYDLMGYEPMAAVLLALVIGLGLHRPMLNVLFGTAAAIRIPPTAIEVGKATAMVATFVLSLVYLAGSTFNPFIYFRF
jgi:alginate O-acetyltransferase complex protein AlgI